MIRKFFFIFSLVFICIMPVKAQSDDTYASQLFNIESIVIGLAAIAGSFIGAIRAKKKK